MAEKLFNVGIKAIIAQDNKVLIVNNSKGFWEVPGGRIDKNESIEQTLGRELREELPNIKSFKVGKVLNATRLHRDIKDEVSLVLIFYKVTAEFEGEVTLSNEHTEYMWATKAEALAIINETCTVAIEQVFNA